MPVFRNGARQVWRHGSQRGQADARMGERERQAEEAAGGSPSGHRSAQDRLCYKALAPQVKRQAMGVMIEQCQLSKRRDCRLVGLSRTSWREVPADTQTLALLKRIIELAHQRRRFGYSRIHDLLRAEGCQVNHKRVWQLLYSEASLAVRRRKKKSKRPVSERATLFQSTRPNEVWSIDFVMDSLANVRRLKYLTVADDFTHESVDITVDHGISGGLRSACTRTSCTVSRLPSGDSNRRWTGIHQPGFSAMGACQGSDRTGQADTECLHRKL